MDQSQPHGLLAAMQRTLEMMRNRQRAMSSTLLAVRTIARRSLRSGIPPDFNQLRRLVAYVERFPQKLHQPAEEQHLFRALERRAPTASRAIARAKRDHAACMGYLYRLNNALGRWVGGQASAGGAVALMADDYVRFCRLHNRIEARDVLSMAIQVLQPDDWRTIGQAYATTKDPLDSSTSRSECAAALGRLALRLPD
jgi:hemerythrin-like domain-containing protein